MYKPHAQQSIAITIQGTVQGVGFRPFIYRLAQSYQQTGWVMNSHTGVEITLTGDSIKQTQFLAAISKQSPVGSDIQSLSSRTIPQQNFADFQIKSSQTQGDYSHFVLPDLSPCPDCLTELFNPNSRFYRYPFISCCACGVRYSIMQAQPYDRIRTSMTDFELCTDCLSDYHNPDNRRFHSQSIACPQCGPVLYSNDGIKNNEHALNLAIKALQNGQIVALKGVGGYQLLVDATQTKAVQRLRDKKQRPAKPFALLLETLKHAQQLCHISPQAEKALCSPASPIVLLPKKIHLNLTDVIAPENEMLGIMLPASPLHQLISHTFGKPLVATSGNLPSQAICTTEADACQQLGEIADVFLHHNRTIIHGLDDSIVRPLHQYNTVFRRARGYVPKPLSIAKKLPKQLALGGHKKNTLAISTGAQLILSPHIGDLNSLSNQTQRQHIETSLCAFYHVNAQQIIHDAHPDYHSSQIALASHLEKKAVQHHQAHILACMAEHSLQPPLLGFAWDGAGLGDDQTIWGSECFSVDAQGFQRRASFHPFPLVGADLAAKEPRRAALGILYTTFGDVLFAENHADILKHFSTTELNLLRPALQKNLNTPLSSSMGRLFDAVACLLDLSSFNAYEGQAAMLLEQAAQHSTSKEYYPFDNDLTDQCLKIDWRPMIRALIADIPHHNKSLIAAKFHNTLAKSILFIAQSHRYTDIVLSGGCFQNALLVKQCAQILENSGFSVYTHKDIPPNDGGLAIGQLYAATLTG